MKSKVFKIALPAFAFMLAIVASFAFTPTQNGLEEEMFITGFVQNGSAISCISVPEICGTNSANPVCETTEDFQGVPLGTQVFAKQGTLCNSLLYRP
ncbi:MAG: DUF6520 family protein [Saonia sp.]